MGVGRKITHQELGRRFESLVPFIRVPFWVRSFDPQPDRSGTDGSWQLREKAGDFGEA